jgi:hypothetical protein
MLEAELAMALCDLPVGARLMLIGIEKLGEVANFVLQPGGRGLTSAILALTSGAASTGF